MEALDRLNQQAQLDQDLAPEINWNLPLSIEKLWIAPELSHLYHLPISQRMSPKLLLRYNQFFAMLVVEQIAAFEKDVLAQVDRKVFAKFKSDPKVAPNLKSALDHFVREELNHVSMFEKLLVRSREALVLEPNFRAFDVSAIQNLALKFLFSFPRVFVFWIWVVLFVEERTLLIARLMNKDGELYDKLHFEVQNAHLRDERRHVRLDEYLLQLCWDPAPLWLRKLNVRLLVMFFKFTFIKSMTAKRLWKKFSAKEPEAMNYDLEVRAQLKQLPHTPSYLDQIFSQHSAPRFWKMINSRAEMEPLRKLR